jgi:hypothetical protein
MWVIKSEGQRSIQWESWQLDLFLRNEHDQVTSWACTLEENVQLLA